jgi:6-phosphogluconolactonase (cycloisomerase 2 family)
MDATSSKAARAAGAFATLIVAACGGGGGSASPLTIGGTVSGLAGSGLVLTDNGSDNLAVSGNGSFTFAHKIPAGSAYSVRVLTQPTNPSQTCTGSNASGHASSSDVTSVTVTCATNLYNVGGVVSGLGSGNVLWLQTNLPAPNDKVFVQANGPFALFQGVSSGTHYGFTVLQTTPPENCTIQNSNGTVAGTDVTNIAVACVPPTYNLVVTVSGLTGSGLVLLGSDGQRLAISSNGSVSFPNPVPLNVQVSFASQPTNPAEFCVGNWTDSTHMAVTCNPDIYAVNITVSGLKGSGLTLSYTSQYLSQNAYVPGPGAAGLLASGNGKFTFATPLASGAYYSARVTTQPVNPAQTCIVVEGDGYLVGTNASLSVSCSVVRFAYGVAPPPNTTTDPAAVAAFAVDSTTGALTALPGSPFATGDTTSALTVDPTGRFLYATNRGASGGVGSNTVSAYSLDSATGVLTAVPGSPFSSVGAPVSIVVEPSGQFAYVANLHDNTISAFVIHATSGALTPIVGGPQTPGLDGPRHLTVHPGGKFVYLSVANEGSIWAYSIDGGTGALTAVPGTPYVNSLASPQTLAITPDGLDAISSGWNTSERGVYADQYEINPASGVLSPNYGGIDLEVAGALVELVLDPGRNFGYALAQPQGTKRIVVPLHSYLYNNGSSYTLSQNSDASGQAVSYSFSTNVLAITPESSGRFLYLTDSTGTVSAYVIDSVTGNLTAAAATPGAISATGPLVFTKQ